MTEGKLDTSPDTIQHVMNMGVQFDPNTGKWYRSIHEILGGKSAFLTLSSGSSATIYTVLSGQVAEMQSLTINNREAAATVLVELFDATSGDPAAGTLVYKRTVAAATAIDLVNLKGYMFSTGVRVRATTASTGVDISIGMQLAVKS